MNAARVAVSAAALVLHLAAIAPAGAQPQELNTLAWLAGCWQREGGEPGSVEHWLAPAGGTMLGISRTVKNGRTVEHEFLQIRSNAEGRLVYIALPSRQREATFTATGVDGGAVSFENPQHDFPQRISYRLLPGDRLAARIEGQRGGQGPMRAIDFAFRRVAC
jgi:hypothetical protein